MLEIFQAVPLLTVALFVRFSIAFWMVPLLGTGPLPLPVIGTVSAILTFFVLPEASVTELVHLSAATAPAVVLSEAAAGLLLGTAIRLCWMVLAVSGGLSNQYALSNPTGPESERYTEHFGRLFFFLGTSSFFLLGGHHSLFLAATRSIDAMPPLGIHPFQFAEGEYLPWILNTFTAMFQFGVLVAAPVIVAALFVELLLAIGARLWCLERGPMFSSIRTCAVQIAVIFFLWKSMAILVQAMGQHVDSAWGWL